MKSNVILNKDILFKLNNIKKKVIKIGFIHLLSANFLLQIASFGGQIFLTKILSVEDIGRIKVLQSFLSNILIIAGLGLNVSILKLCSEKITNERREILFKLGFILSLVFSVFITIITVLIAYLNGFSTDHNINNLMKIFALQIPFLVISVYFASYLQSQKKIHLMSKVQSISKIIVVFISILGAFLYGIQGYVIILVITLSLTTLLFIPFLKSELKSFKFRKIEKQIYSSPLKIGSYSLITNLFGQLVLTLNILYLNYSSSNQKEIGYYGIAQLLITSMMIVPNTLNQLMIPYLSEQTGNFHKIKSMLKTFEKRMLIMSASLCIIALLLVPIFLPLVFGKEYINSVPFFRILIVGLFFWSIYSPKGITLVSIGRVDTNFKVSFISLIINIILNMILISHYGAQGAAIATTVTYFITIFINNYFYKKVVVI